MTILLVWDELQEMWSRGDFKGAHDWLNEHWSVEVKDLPDGDRQPRARFLQGLAFTALAFHFALEQNRESTGLFVHDGLQVLPSFVPSYAGIQVTPLVDALGELQATLQKPEASGFLVVPDSGRVLRYARSL